MRTQVILKLIVATVFATLPVAAPTHAQQDDVAAFYRGRQISMYIGSAAGGLAYGSAHWHAPLLRQFAVMLAIMGVGLAALAAPWSPVAFAALCVVAGVVMAPALIIQSMLVAKTAKPEHTTEAFTWSSSALLAGVGLGMALGGVLVEIWRSPASFAAAGAAAMAAAIGALWLSRR